MSDADLLTLDDRTLSKRVPIRAIKRPYAQHDATKLKSRAKRLAWADEAQRRDAERIATKRKRLEAERIGAKKKPATVDKAAAGGQRHAGGGAAAGGVAASERAGGGGAEGEVRAGVAAIAAAGKRKPGRDDGRDAPRGAKPKRKREEAPEPAAESKRGVAANRLAAFAQVNKRSKKEARVEQKERKRKEKAAGAPASKWL